MRAVVVVVVVLLLLLLGKVEEWGEVEETVDGSMGAESGA